MLKSNKENPKQPRMKRKKGPLADMIKKKEREKMTIDHREEETKMKIEEETAGTGLDQDPPPIRADIIPQDTKKNIVKIRKDQNPITIDWGMK